MTKGLFTSSEEIAFQYNYVNGNITPPRDPNTRRNPAKTKSLCVKRPHKKVSRLVLGRVR